MNETGQTASPATVGGGTIKYPYDMHVQKGLNGYDFRHVLSINYSYDLPFGRQLFVTFRR